MVNYAAIKIPINLLTGSRGMKVTYLPMQLYLFMNNLQPHPGNALSILFVNKSVSVHSMLFSVNNAASQIVKRCFYLLSTRYFRTILPQNSKLTK